MVIFFSKALLKNKDLCCSGIFLLSYHISQIALEGHGLQVNQKWKINSLVYLRKAKYSIKKINFSELSVSVFLSHIRGESFHWSDRKCKCRTVTLNEIEETDLDKSNGTLPSLEISWVAVISGWFLPLLPLHGGGLLSHIEWERKRENILSVFGSTKREILHLSELINATFHQETLSDSEASPVSPLGL